MIEAGYLTGNQTGLDIPLPSVNWIRPWDTIAVIAILLAMWFLICYICEMVDDPENIEGVHCD